VTILYRVGLLFSVILSVVTVSCICGLSCDDIVLIEFFIRLFRENLETKTTYMLWRYRHQPPLKSNNGGLHPKYMDGFRAQVPAVCAGTIPALSIDAFGGYRCRQASHTVTRAQIVSVSRFGQQGSDLFACHSLIMTSSGAIFWGVSCSGLPPVVDYIVSVCKSRL
jgi:hypothetical protein